MSVIGAVMKSKNKKQRPRTARALRVRWGIDIHTCSQSTTKTESVKEEKSPHSGSSQEEDHEDVSTSR